MTSKDHKKGKKEIKNEREKTQKASEALEKEGKREFELKQKIPTRSLVLLLSIRENEG